ncbi:MAG: hypothetical protein WC889_02820 [Myxococcota bacterium]|jgi:hypothetical protein
MTFGAIKSRIADELVRPDLASQIALAVNDAIGEAANTRFWFNEVRGLTFSTVDGQGFYDSEAIGQLSRIDALWIISNGQRRNMDLVNSNAIESWLEGQATLTGEPFAYARQANGLLLWMVPNAVYPVYIDGVTRFAALSADADTNPYIEDGERYIRALTKANILEDVVRDFEEADRQWAKADREKGILMAGTSTRLTTNTNMACL